MLKHPGGKDVLVSGRPDNHDILWINQQIHDLLSVRPNCIPCTRCVSGRFEAALRLFHAYSAHKCMGVCSCILGQKQAPHCPHPMILLSDTAVSFGDGLQLGKVVV